MNFFKEFQQRLTLTSAVLLTEKNVENVAKELTKLYAPKYTFEADEKNLVAKNEVGEKIFTYKHGVYIILENDFLKTMPPESFHEKYEAVQFADPIIKRIEAIEKQLKTMPTEQK